MTTSSAFVKNYAMLIFLRILCVHWSEKKSCMIALRKRYGSHAVFRELISADPHGLALPEHAAPMEVRRPGLGLPGLLQLLWASGSSFPFWPLLPEM